MGMNIFLWTLYFIACTDGFYGINCHQVCSPLCLNQPCDRRTGACIGGCVHGLQGFNCTQGQSLSCL